ncbi:MAG: RdgB/HAM1 family non-canonical purine NTP pyrophosphatase [Deltaproteobacteria bacterium]|nr:RdgB/HAM1 family non-canonical purine NTP pyrophosphatase [Deltaproteobacteria bacterium]
MKRLVVGTGNAGKLTEIRRKLEGAGFEIVTLRDLGLSVDVEEDEETFAGNARKKAAAVSLAAGLPALADDSGIEVDVLGGRPGVRSARYGGNGLDDAARNALLLRELAGVPAGKRTARFRCALAFAAPDQAPHMEEGTFEGSIAFAPAGDYGFGYDPIFVPAGFDRTLSELGAEVKNRLSHRARALDLMKLWLLAHRG